MAFEDLLLSSQSDSADRSRAVMAQGIRTFPESHILKKGVHGPFKVIQGDVPAMAGYRIFIHSVTLAGVNSAATDMSAVTYAGYIDGAAVFFASCPLIPNVANCNAVSHVVDTLFDEGLAVSFITFATSFVSAFGSASYCYIRPGDE